MTKHDIRIETCIRRLINQYYPDHSILGEEIEYKKGKSQFEWCIDPIDGTKALIAGQPTWSNMIGLSYKGNPIHGLVYFYELDKFYYNDAKNSYKVSKRQKNIIRAGNISNLKDAYLITNSIHTIKSKKILDFFQNYKYLFKITGTDALNFSLLCESKIDILIESGLKKYDIIPHLPIIKNSGAVITDWKGGNDILKGEIVVSANLKLHNKFIKLLQSEIY